jgi:hypothetical protein
MKYIEFMIFKCLKLFQSTIVKPKPIKWYKHVYSQRVWLQATTSHATTHDSHTWFCSRSGAAHNISKSLIGYAAISVATHTSSVLSYGLWPGAKQPLYVLRDRYINLD